MTVQYKGNTAIREAGRDRSVRGGQIVMTLTYQGLYDDLIANEPAQGAIWDENNAFAVDTAQTKRLDGGVGETVVTYLADSSLQTIDTTKDVRIEIMWVRNDAPLIFQQAFATDSTGCMDIECKSLVEDYLQARTASKRTAIKALIDAFGAAATKYLELRVRGVDSIVRFLPIVRKTTTAVLRPALIGADLGKVQAPVTGVGITVPATFTTWNPMTNADATATLRYMKMRDDATKTGRNKRWERTEEWHGYPEEDLKLNGRIA